MLLAGLNDLIKVGGAEELKESVLDFEEVVRHQNRHHTLLGCNELYLSCSHLNLPGSLIMGPCPRATVTG